MLVAFELFYYTQGHNGTNGDTLLKLDMSKAFDRVEWTFLEGIMLWLGFEGELGPSCHEMHLCSFLLFYYQSSFSRYVSPSI